MEIHTNLTEKDLIEFNSYHVGRSKALWAYLAPGFLWSGFWLYLALQSDEPLKSIMALRPLLWGGPLYIVTLLVLW